MQSQFNSRLMTKLRGSISLLLLVPVFLFAKSPLSDRAVQGFIGTVESTMARSDWNKSSNQMILDNAMERLTQRVELEHKLKLLQTSVISPELMALYIHEVEQTMAEASWRYDSEQLGLFDQISRIYFTSDSNAIGLNPEAPSDEQISRFINAVEASMSDWNSPEYVSFTVPRDMVTGL